MIRFILLVALTQLQLPTAWAQQPTKTRVATLPNDPPKTKVPLVDDPSDTDLLPVKPSKGKSTTTPKTNTPQVPLVDNPDPNDLLDIKVPSTQPLAPNAGDLVYQEIPLNGSYSFNKKLTFTLRDPEIGSVTASSWLNTRTGYAWLDDANLKRLAKEQMEESADWVIAPTGDFIMYMKSSEGRFVSKSRGQGEWVAQDFMTKFEVDEFKKIFKATKRVQAANQAAGIPFTRQAYTGVVEGKPTTLWLSASDDVRINTKFTSMITGVFGLGYIALSPSRTYLITGMEQGGSSLFLTNISNQSSQFSGKGYKPLGQVAAPYLEQSKANQRAEAEAFEKALREVEDPKLRQLMREQQQQMQAMQQGTLDTKFATTSDMRDLPGANNDQTIMLIASQFDVQIQELRVQIREKEIQRKEIGEGGGTTEEQNRLTCEIGCHNQTISFLQKLKTDYNNQAKRLAKDPDRMTKLGELVATRMTNQPSCNCP